MNRHFYARVSRIITYDRAVKQYFFSPPSRFELYTSCIELERSNNLAVFILHQLNINIIDTKTLKNALCKRKRNNSKTHKKFYTEKP